MVVLGLLTLIGGLLPLANVYLTKELVDGLTELSGNPTGPSTRFLTLVGILVFLLLFSEVIDVVTGWVRMGYAELVADEIQTRIHHKAIHADYQHFEIPTYYDQLFLVTSGAEEQFTDAIDNVFTLIRSGVTLMAMIGVIAGFHVWLPAALVLASIPTLALVLTQSKRVHALRKRLIPDERRADYYDWLMQSDESAAEIRLYRLGESFKQRYRNLRKAIRHAMLNLEKRQMVHRLLAKVFGLSMMGGALILIINRALAGQFSIGDVAMFYRTIKYSHDVGIEFVKGIGDLNRNAIFLTDFFRFLDNRHQTDTGSDSASFPPRLHRGIEFKKVRFHYPETQKTVLNDLDLFIPAGKTTAILGPNGSGKSTVLKLLTKLYTEYEGEITVDETSLRQINHDSLRDHIAVLLQDPMNYHLSLRENITALTPSGGKTGPSLEQTVQAAALEPILRKLPEGLETPLGKWLHRGQELSGGEWHRVATARALFPRSAVLILDEPTSTLDPWSEAKWFQRVRSFHRQQTLVVITHRVSLARHADHICVMDQGGVAESGSHPQLIERNGLYAKINR